MSHVEMSSLEILLEHDHIDGEANLPAFAPDVPHASLATYLRTLQYLRFSQFGYLIKRRFRGSPVFPPKGRTHQRLKDLRGALWFPEWLPTLARKMIDTGEFTFLNVTRPVVKSVPWSGAYYDPLWLCTLNYFDFLNLALKGPNDAPLLRKALKLAADWQDCNPTGKEVGWDPYPTSLRVVNWLKFLSHNMTAALELGESAAIDRILFSLHAQVLWLERRLETGLLNNHVIKNAKALIFASAMLDVPETQRWWSKGKALLQREVNRQILPDGGHFERSPMYHSQVLEDLLDLNVLATWAGVELGEAQYADQIKRMVGFLDQMVHPDGEIALFGDCALRVSRPASELLFSATGDASDCAKSGVEVRIKGETGYATISNTRSGSALIFDCGPLGPDYQPGHGHCDLLSYELSLREQRVIVDTGVSTYEAGPARHYERSTAAHNTLRVDGEEQAEIWSSFRVGRRPRVDRIHGGEVGGLYFVRGRHFGYKHLGVIHSRTIVHVPNDSWVVVDSLWGKGRHRAECFIHFHPKVQVERGIDDGQIGDEDGPTWLVRLRDSQYFLLTSQRCQFGLATAWYSPEFGKRQKQSVLYGVWEADLPTNTLYAVVPAGLKPCEIRLGKEQTSVEIDGIVIPLT